MRAAADPAFAAIEERSEQVSGRYLAGLRAVADTLDTAYRARLAAQDEAITALRRRVAATEAERDALRARLAQMCDTPQATPAPAEAPKDETIATLREHRDRPRQAPPPLAARVTDTAGGQDTPGRSASVPAAAQDMQAEAAVAAPQVAERERDALRARLAAFVGPPLTPPADPGTAEGAPGGADTPQRPAGLWSRLRRALGRR